MQGVPDLEYVSADGVGACLEKHKGRVLGLVAFGDGLGAEPPELQPAPLRVRIPVLGGQRASYEVWSSGNPVTACGQGNVTAHADGAVLFGSMQQQQPVGVTLEEISRQAYREIFAFMDGLGYPRLLRTWNYLPRINEPEGGLERYRCFNVGRHDAYVASGRGIAEEHAPAASVLGCGDGPMTVYFIAARTAGKPVDNPRQLTALRYPEQYGPRSPIFVRAMQAGDGVRQCLMISGTASIIGHETAHKEDVAQQGREIMHNIRILLRQAGMEGDGAGRMALKVYVRQAGDLAQARALVEEEFGGSQQAIYLLSDICRADLLLEIEGYYLAGR
jgi:enamine deaminase RidA (YjgF/YER057c/UK114 family)